MRILVLGSSGQIGSYLMERNDHEMYPYDIVDSPVLDLRDPDGPLRDALSQVDYCMFLAFDVGGSGYLREYQHSYGFIDNNTRIMQNTFQALVESGVPFLFASSQMSNMAHSPYGALKAVGEFYTRSLGGAIVKFWNVYGIEKDPEKTHVITDFVRGALETGEVRMRTTGEEERQFLYGVDCADALVEIAEEHVDTIRVLGGIPDLPDFHVTSFEWTSIKEVAYLVAELTGAKVVPGLDTDSIQGVRNEPDPQIFDLMDWRPKVGLKAGIAQIVKEERNDG